MKKYMAFSVVQGALTAVAAILFVVAIIDDLRAEARGFVIRDYRKVISTAETKLPNRFQKITVAKIKTRDSLSLEFYETVAEGHTKLIDKITLRDRRDGYFSFNGRATNLAIEDIDGDGFAEILAPTFDDSLVGHINVFTFNVDSGSFENILR